MKKSLVVVALLLFCAPLMFATLVTNMNQSALYFRLLSRNASTDVDAVFYNPAGVMRLKNGWHFSLSNQTIFQTKTVINGFPLLNNGTYEGKVNVPIFPDFYAVYKMEKLAFSFGFGPNSGGGTANFSKGLPSFEIPYTEFAYLMSFVLGVNRYSEDIAFEGNSAFWGFQANVSATLTDWLDAAVGGRLIIAHNSYVGSIKNFMFNPGGGPMVNASQFFTVIGRPDLAFVTADKTVNAAQNGTGITPLLSLNFRPADGLNIGVKYEFITKLTLTNDPTTDDLGLFPASVKVHNDIPAILSLGVEYALPSALKATASFNYFFDKNADWDGRELLVDSNSWDLGTGLEFRVTESIALSAGFLHTQYSLLPAYNTDFSHEMSNNSIGFGGRVGLANNLEFDLGLLMTFYDKNQRTIDYGPFLTWPEEYKRTNFGFALGVNYHIGQ